MIFPIVMYGCESWTIRKAEHQRIDAFELCWRRLLRVPWTVRRSNHLSPKGNQPWMFNGRTNTDAEADVKSQLFGKDPDAGKDWGQEKGVTEDEVVGGHHQLHGHDVEQTLGDSEGQESLACYSPWGPKESDRLSYWTRPWSTWPTLPFQDYGRDPWEWGALHADSISFMVSRPPVTKQWRQVKCPQKNG